MASVQRTTPNANSKVSLNSTSEANGCRSEIIQHQHLIRSLELMAEAPAITNAELLWNPAVHGQPGPKSETKGWNNAISFRPIFVANNGDRRNRCTEKDLGYCGHEIVRVVDFVKPPGGINQMRTGTIRARKQPIDRKRHRQRRVYRTECQGNSNERWRRSVVWYYISELVRTNTVSETQHPSRPTLRRVP